MAEVINDIPLIVITGPTASGKTGLAIELAEKFNGEIICADSRSVYRYMDIGTAKPDADDRRRVVHWGLDLVDPGERFTAADFKSYAIEKIKEIRSRGHVPFIVGGTGLYVDAVVFDYEFGGDIDAKRRAELNGMTTEELQLYCENNNITAPENSSNRRHLIRAIERGSISLKRREQPINNCYIVGISTDRNVLRSRIELRAEQLFENGVVDEATMLGKKYGWGSEAMTGNIYPLVKLLIDGEMSMTELKEKFITSDWRLAKRQLTWMRRNEHITWLGLGEARTYLTRVLANDRQS